MNARPAVLVAIAISVVAVLAGACRVPSPPAPPPVIITSPSTTTTTVPPILPWPPAPSREELLKAQLTFQGLTLTCGEEFSGPWFEIAIDVLTSACRERLYEMKRAAGDRVVAMAVSHAYQEPGIHPVLAAGRDWTNNLAPLRALIDDTIRAGFYVQLHLAGDGETSRQNPDGSWAYNDPVGWTYGCPWLIETLPRLLAAFDGVHRYIRYVVGFDGVFYGCTPEQLVVIGQVFRRALPDGILGLEHDPGHIPFGGGPADYAAGGRMQDYDFILGEYPEMVSGDVVWQVLGRMVRPYRRPAEQSAADDPAPPFYLAQPSPRGPFVYNCFEFDLYRWVRGRVTAAEIDRERRQLRTLGCQVTG